MSSSDQLIPNHLGSLTDSAIAVMTPFASGLQARWIAGFYYYTSSKFRQKDGADWIEQGPGIGLGAFERKSIGRQNIHMVNGLEFIIQIPIEIWNKAPRGFIDIDPNKKTQFILS